MFTRQIVNHQWNHLVLLGLIITSLLGACGPAMPTVEVTIRAALPTPTFEPTFTPSPPPTTTPRPSPTATPAEPTPTPTRQPLLSGRILDQDTNQPVAGATVRVGAAAATTDAEGRYTLTGLPPGQYVLSVTHPDYDPGLSSIFTLAAGQEQSLNLALYAPDASPYPKDPMLTNPLDPNGAPTPKDAERLARLQGLTGEVVGIRETKLSGEYLVNYKIGDEVRAAVAELNHDVWELTDDAGRQWWIIQVCGNLAQPISTEVIVATPEPHPLPPMAEVMIDKLIARECASETCAELGTVQRGTQIEVIGCMADGSWCQVSLPGGGSGWCAGRSLRQLAVAEAVPAVKVVLPTAMPGVVAVGEGKIAFVSAGRDGNYRNFDIYTINPDGSGLTRLTNHPGRDEFPAWSPDGRKIAFYSNRDEPDPDNCGRGGKPACNVGIYVMNADGGDVTYLINDGHVSTWSPDGQKIAFVSYRDASLTSGLGGNIYVMNADGTDVTRLTNLGWNQQQGPTSPWSLAWSPDGQRIAFDALHLGSEGGREIYVINVDGSGLTRLTNSLMDDYNPAWSPDSRQIAFVSYRDADFQKNDHNTEIYVMNADGSGLMRLTYDPGGDEDPTWSPDGQRIAFRSYRDGMPDIYWMNADGSGVTQLTFEGDNWEPDWSRR